LLSVGAAADAIGIDPKGYYVTVTVCGGSGSAVCVGGVLDSAVRSHLMCSILTGSDVSACLSHLN
jgi:hypothetical protein